MFTPLSSDQMAGISGIGGQSSNSCLDIMHHKRFETEYGFTDKQQKLFCFYF